MSAPFLEQQAKKFLELKFDGVRGYTLLAQIATPDSGFGDAFGFSFDELQSARTFTTNGRGLFDNLMSVWFQKGATVKDLKEALENWEKTLLLKTFRLDEIKDNATVIRSAKTTAEFSAPPPPPPPRDPILVEVEKLDQMFGAALIQFNLVKQLCLQRANLN